LLCLPTGTILFWWDRQKPPESTDTAMLCISLPQGQGQCLEHIPCLLLHEDCQAERRRLPILVERQCALHTHATLLVHLQRPDPVPHHVVMLQGTAFVFTRGDRAGEPVFVQRHIHLRWRPVGRLRDAPPGDYLQGVRPLPGDLQAEVGPRRGLIEALDLCTDGAPLRKRLPLQHHLWCVDGPCAVTCRNGALALGKNRL